MSRYIRVPAAFAVAALAVLPQAGPAATPAAAQEQCQFPSDDYKGTPWSLQRVNLEDMWKAAGGKGKGVRVAVIDSGVDIKNRQLTAAVDAAAGANFLPKKPKPDQYGQVPERGAANGTSDEVGHGTRVAGIIAASEDPTKKTGFVGIAPEATIIPIKQNDANGTGTSDTMAQAIDHAVKQGADVINISQDTAKALPAASNLEVAVENALANNVVVIASAGNDGLDRKTKKTYPASYPGVLAVAASDRNNERAPFSQSGDFVGIAAPGVDMVSTVPGGGHCTDNGTSFSAPYVAGVAALLVAKHPDWKPNEIVAQLEQTAERSIRGHDVLVGWGVVDPVRALTEDAEPIEAPQVDKAGKLDPANYPTAARIPVGESEQQRNERIGSYAVVAGVVLVALTAGIARVFQDRAKRRRRTV
ncbi:hypothetical protein SRB5_63710 [Streptomyces sp. RB5]|uniref:Peptidase S8/S53 domain-containing protein n=1 Tax=Streptomyces smaragdinus TaxID=2585196 RepID=A0A7K0CRQ7_9ACTN|nr:type VII secretion-associated serine protease mycosin [Streptomyces smaragdinus]MQY16175.1 hypothetical protein [Streptomyces smaragdinus]